MEREVGPAFERRYRDTPSSNLGVRLAETVQVGQYSVDLGNPAFAPRSEPHVARAPGAQMMRMPAGRSPAFQLVSRDSIFAMLSILLSATISRSSLRNFVTDIQGVTDDVRGLGGGAMIWCELFILPRRASPNPPKFVFARGANFHIFLAGPTAWCPDSQGDPPPVLQSFVARSVGHGTVTCLKNWTASTKRSGDCRSSRVYQNTFRLAAPRPCRYKTRQPAGAG
eukprot:gene14758-biopygen14213